jgi:hypothetical protein
MHAGACTYAQAAGRGINNLCDNQIKNAKIIMEVARNNGFGRRGKVVALAAALVESRLVNVQFGDRCSYFFVALHCVRSCCVPQTAVRQCAAALCSAHAVNVGDILSCACTLAELQLFM